MVRYIGYDGTKSGWNLGISKENNEEAKICVGGKEKMQHTGKWTFSAVRCRTKAKRNDQHPPKPRLLKFLAEKGNFFY